MTGAEHDPTIAAAVDATIDPGIDEQTAEVSAAARAAVRDALEARGLVLDDAVVEVLALLVDLGALADAAARPDAVAVLEVLPDVARDAARLLRDRTEASR